MKKNRVLAVIMAVLMMVTLLPSMVFAAAVPQGALDGKLKVKGTIAVGVTLSADYSKVKPEGITDDYVSFSWSLKDGDVLTEVGTDKTYKVEEKDLGLTATVIARDGIAVVVNNDNDIDELTSDQVKAIFTGETTDWEDLAK